MSSKSDEMLFTPEEAMLFQKLQLMGIPHLVKGVDVALAKSDWLTVKVYSILLMKKYNALYESATAKVAESTGQKAKALKKAKDLTSSIVIDVDKTLKGSPVYRYDEELNPATVASAFNEAHHYSDRSLAVQVNMETFVSLITEEWFLRDFVTDTSVEVVLQGSPGKYMGVPLIYRPGCPEYLAQGLHFFALETK
jgi:hypothetical protein